MDTHSKGLLCFPLQAGNGTEITAMPERGGGFVYCEQGSIVRLIGFARYADYVASKHAVLRMTKPVGDGICQSRTSAFLRSLLTEALKRTCISVL